MVEIIENTAKLAAFILFIVCGIVGVALLTIGYIDRGALLLVASFVFLITTNSIDSGDDK